MVSDEVLVQDSWAAIALQLCDGCNDTRQPRVLEEGDSDGARAEDTAVAVA